MKNNGVPGAFGRQGNSVWEKGRKYFGAPSQKQVGPPRGHLKAFTYCAGIEILALGGAPDPTLEWAEGKALIGRNLGLNLEMWLLDYKVEDDDDWAHLSAQFAEKPAYLALYESEKNDKAPWLHGKSWNVMDNPPQNTVGGLYIVVWPSSWQDCREEEADSNVGFTAVLDGEGYSLGIYVAGFEYLLARNPRAKYRDKNGLFVGLFWEFKDEQGQLVAVTLRQDEDSQKVPAPEVSSGNN